MICDCCHRNFALADLKKYNDRHSDMSFALCVFCVENKCGICYSGLMHCLQHPTCENMINKESGSVDFCSELCRKAYWDKHKFDKPKTLANAIEDGDDLPF